MHSGDRRMIVLLVNLQASTSRHHHTPQFPHRRTPASLLPSSSPARSPPLFLQHEHITVSVDPSLPVQQLLGLIELKYQQLLLETSSLSSDDSAGSSDERDAAASTPRSVARSPPCLEHHIRVRRVLKDAVYAVSRADRVQDVLADGEQVTAVVSLRPGSPPQPQRRQPSVGPAQSVAAAETEAAQQPLVHAAAAPAPRVSTPLGWNEPQPLPDIAVSSPPPIPNPSVVSAAVHSSTPPAPLSDAAVDATAVLPAASLEADESKEERVEQRTAATGGLMSERKETEPPQVKNRRKRRREVAAESVVERKVAEDNNSSSSSSSSSGSKPQRRAPVVSAAALQASESEEQKAAESRAAAGRASEQNEQQQSESGAVEAKEGRDSPQRSAAAPPAEQRRPRGRPRKEPPPLHSAFTAEQRLAASSSSASSSSSSAVTAAAGKRKQAVDTEHKFDGPADTAFTAAAVSSPAVSSVASAVPPRAVPELVAAVRCVLCCQPDGVLKRTDSGSWCHLVCCEWTRGTSFDWSSHLVLGCQHALKLSAKYSCSLCSLPAGVSAPILCEHDKCKAAFHLTCAQRAGQQTAEVDDPGRDRRLFVAVCPRHEHDELRESNDDGCAVCRFTRPSLPEVSKRLQCRVCGVEVHKTCYYGRDNDLLSDSEMDEDERKAARAGGAGHDQQGARIDWESWTCMRCEFIISGVYRFTKARLSEGLKDEKEEEEDDAEQDSQDASSRQQQQQRSEQKAAPARKRKQRRSKAQKADAEAAAEAEANQRKRARMAAEAQEESKVAAAEATQQRATGTGQRAKGRRPKGSAAKERRKATLQRMGVVATRADRQEVESRQAAETVAARRPEEESKEVPQSNGSSSRQQPAASAAALQPPSVSHGDSRSSASSLSASVSPGRASGIALLEAQARAGKTARQTPAAATATSSTRSRQPAAVSSSSAADAGERYLSDAAAARARGGGGADALASDGAEAAQDRLSVLLSPAGRQRSSQCGGEGGGRG